MYQPSLEVIKQQLDTMSELIPADYAGLPGDIKRHIRVAQCEASDDQACVGEENPLVGISLCKSKDRGIVEYVLRETNKPIGVADYRIVSTLPAELQDQLPAPKQVAKLLEGIG